MISDQRYEQLTKTAQVWMAGRPRKHGAYHEPTGRRTPCNLTIGRLDPDGNPEHGELMTLHRARERYVAHPCSHCYPRHRWTGTP